MTLMSTRQTQVPSRQRLYGRFQHKHNKTVLMERYHDAPMKISKTHPLYPGDELYVCMMDASPGLMEGDHYEIMLELEENAGVYFTNQSSTKIHPCHGEGSSSLNQHFRLRKNSLLEFIPEPVIPFKQSRFSNHMDVFMEEGSQFAYADIISPGRSHLGEQFLYDYYESRMNVYWLDRLIANERFYSAPFDGRYQELCNFGSFSHAGSLWLFSEQITETFVHAVRNLLQDTNHHQLLTGASILSKHGMVVRALGFTTWAISECFHSIWSLWRKDVLKRPLPVIRK